MSNMTADPFDPYTQIFTIKMADGTPLSVSMADFDGFNEVWSEFFDESGPTRTTVAVRELPNPLLLVEMKAVAYAPVK